MTQLQKIALFFTVSLLLLLAGSYLLYPWLNPAGYQEVMERHGDLSPFQTDWKYLAEEMDDLIGQLEETREREIRLKALVDSLEQANRLLEEQAVQRSAGGEHHGSSAGIRSRSGRGVSSGTGLPGTVRAGAGLAGAGSSGVHNSSVGNAGVNRAGLTGPAGNREVDTEFFEKIKSLLSLDEEELAPIVNQLSNEQLILLYNGGGNLQKEKLLRALSPERAAAIITEIML